MYIQKYIKKNKLNNSVLKNLLNIKNLSKINSKTTFSTNFGRDIDLFILGENHMWHGKKIAFDPEGLLSTLPAIISVVSGYLLGLLIQKYKQMVDLGRGANFGASGRGVQAGDKPAPAPQINHSV